MDLSFPVTVDSAEDTSSRTDASPPTVDFDPQKRLLAVLAAALVAASVGGCDWMPLFGGQTLDSVTVSPQTVTFTAVDETQALTATPRDEDGNEFTDEVNISWRSSNRSAVEVNPTGDRTAEARAVGAGEAQVFATASADDREVEGRASAEVDQVVVTVSVSPESATLTALDATQDFDAAAEDANGNAIPGEDFAWSSSPQSVATVDSEGTATAQENGTATIEAEASGESGSAELIVDQEVADVSVSPDSGKIEALGETLDFDAALDDANGNPVEGAQPSWTSRDTDVATVDPDGTAEARGDGSTHIVAEANGVRDSAQLVVEDTGGDGEESNLVASSFALKPRGVLETGTVRADATIRNGGDGAAGSFRWEIRSGGSVLASGEVSGLGAGSSVSIPTQTGLGPFAAGDHRLTLEVDVNDAVPESSEGDNTAQSRLESFPPGFEIELQFVGEPSDAFKDAARSAADRWSQVITGELVDISFSDPIDLNDCLGIDSGAGTRTEPIDDLLVLVHADSIDGEGDGLASGGRCFIRINTADPNQPPFSLIGFARVDTADLDRIRENGQLYNTILHEMGHALGIGVWNSQGGDGEGPWQLRQGTGREDPIFTGPLAIERFLDEVGGDEYDGRPVPVENTGGEGTRDSHWRESVFGDELMSGFSDLEDDEDPISVVTIASLADQFYAVDLGEADTYQLPISSSSTAQEVRIERHSRPLPQPQFGVDVRTGEVVVIRPPDEQERR